MLNGPEGCCTLTTWIKFLFIMQQIWKILGMGGINDQFTLFWFIYFIHRAKYFWYLLFLCVERFLFSAVHNNFVLTCLSQTKEWIHQGIQLFFFKEPSMYKLCTIIPEFMLHYNDGTFWLAVEKTTFIFFIVDDD